jgi:YD repeat-containing protein
VVQQQWGAASGALDALLDANAHKTRWERDLGGRVRREIRADDLTTTSYTYDALGRLKTVTDPKQPAFAKATAGPP